MQRTYRIELTWEQRNGRWRWVMGDEEEWDAWWRWGVGNEEGGRGHGGCWPVMRERRWGVAMREVLAMRSRVKRGVGDEEWRQEKCWRWGVATREVSGYDGVAMSHDGDISGDEGRRCGHGRWAIWKRSRAMRPSSCLISSLPFVGSFVRFLNCTLSVLQKFSETNFTKLF